MTANLIISADDYAMSAAVDAGILSLIRMGRVTAASCMTLSPRWQEAANRIAGEASDKADIGLHLDFTQYPQPQQHALPVLIARSFCRTLDRTAIRASIHHQLDRFEESLEKAPDYVDGHQHVHQLPQIRDELLGVLSQRYAGSLPWIRIARPPLRDGLKATVIGLLGARQMAGSAKRSRFAYNENLLGVYEFGGDAADYRQRLSAWLDQAQANGTAVLMCHPAVSCNAAAEEGNDPIYRARLHEHDVLASEYFSRLLGEKAVTLVRGDVLRTSECQTNQASA